VARGFYTIGPCGEELLASDAAHAFRQQQPQHGMNDDHGHVNDAVWRYIIVMSVSI
jgi:hypothetical protein